MKKLMLFIHGFGGEKVKSWGNFPHLLEDDLKISSEYEFAFYEYPTGGALKIINPLLPTINTITDGLATEIEQKYPTFEEIFLVGHSMGGIIARQYIVNERKLASGGKTPKVNKLITFAAPNNGVEISRLINALPRMNPQLNELPPESEFLRQLNDDWELMQVEENVEVTFVVGGLDIIVSEHSAKYRWGKSHYKTIINKGHNDMVKPDSADDLPFLILKNKALIGVLNTEIEETSQKITICIADDFDSARIGISELLKKFNQIEVILQISNDDAVVPAVLKHKPQVLLIDLKWNGNDDRGAELISLIKEQYPTLICIAMTAHFNLVETARLSGADGALKKPFTINQLIDLINALIN